MLSLADLHADMTTTIRWRGRDHTLRALRHSEIEAIDRQIPMPAEPDLPPGLTDAQRQGLQRQSGHAAKRDRAVEQRSYLMLFIALGITDRDGAAWSAERSPEWCAAVADIFGGLLTRSEFFGLIGHYNKFEGAAWSDPEKWLGPSGAGGGAGGEPGAQPGN